MDLAFSIDGSKIKTFLENFLVVEEGVISRCDLYTGYVDWCKGNNTKFVGGNIFFDTLSIFLVKEVTGEEIILVRIKRKWHYSGIGWKDERDKKEN